MASRFQKLVVSTIELSVGWSGDEIPSGEYN